MSRIVKGFASALVLLTPIYYFLKIPDYQYYMIANISVASIMVIFLISQQQQSIEKSNSSVNGNSLEQAIKESLTDDVKTGRVKVSLDKPLKMNVDNMDVVITQKEDREFKAIATSEG